MCKQQVTRIQWNLFAHYTGESYRTGCEANVLFVFCFSRDKSEMLEERDGEREKGRASGPALLNLANFLPSVTCNIAKSRYIAVTQATGKNELLALIS